MMVIGVGNIRPKEKPSALIFCEGIMKEQNLIWKLKDGQDFRVSV
jgi:hypothetical protein